RRFGYLLTALLHPLAEPIGCLHTGQMQRRGLAASQSSAIIESALVISCTVQRPSLPYPKACRREFFYRCPTKISGFTLEKEAIHELEGVWIAWPLAGVRTGIC